MKSNKFYIMWTKHPIVGLLDNYKDSKLVKVIYVEHNKGEVNYWEPLDEDLNKLNILSSEESSNIERYIKRLIKGQL